MVQWYVYRVDRGRVYRVFSHYVFPSLLTSRRERCVCARNPAQGGGTLWKVSSGCRVFTCETLRSVFAPSSAQGFKPCRGSPQGEECPSVKYCTVYSRSTTTQGSKTPSTCSSGYRMSMCESLYSVFSPQTLHRVARPRLPASLGACGNTVQCILAQTLHRVAKPRLPAPLGACGDTVQCIRVAITGQGRKALYRCSTGCRLHTCAVYKP